MGNPDEFTPDFFNNVAAVGMVLIFAKVVVHRNRDVDRGGIAAGAHVLAVVAAAAAVAFSLIGTEREWSSSTWHWIVGGALGGAGLLLILEIAIDDLRPVRQRHCGPNSVSGGRQPIPGRFGP